MVEGWTIDVHWWGEAIKWFAGMTVSLGVIWKVWLKGIVEWFLQQGETNTKVAHVITEELPKMTKAIERVSDTQRDHSKRIEDLDHRVAHIETNAVAGGMTAYESGPPMTTRRRRASE